MEHMSKNTQLERQVLELAEELNEVRKKEVPNIEELIEKISKERLEKERKKWEHERDQITKDLQNRVDKVVQLEMDLGDMKDAYRTLE